MEPTQICIRDCPFCGSEAALEQWTSAPDVTWYWVACLRCRIMTPMTQVEARAVPAWNRRSGGAEDELEMVQRGRRAGVLK